MAPHFPDDVIECLDAIDHVSRLCGVGRPGVTVAMPWGSLGHTSMEPIAALMFAGSQTVAGAADSIHSLASAHVLFSRTGGAKEFIMYIGAGAILIIILIVLFLR